ncbi:MAG TPA: SH3 domain-containing protein [Leucothrix mucor]|nr:SH3 domain-containing protein [Leucothrix mucor]
MIKKILPLIFLLMCSFQETYAKGPAWFTVTASPHLIVRSVPSVMGKKLGKLPKNSMVKVLKFTAKTQVISGEYGRWLLVEFKKGKGYVFSAYVKEGNKQKSAWYKVTASPHLFVRSRSSVMSSKLGKLPKNSLVKVIKFTNKSQVISGKKGRWVLIQFKKKRGYVFSGHLKKK